MTAVAWEIIKVAALLAVLAVSLLTGWLIYREPGENGDGDDHTHQHRFARVR